MKVGLLLLFVSVSADFLVADSSSSWSVLQSSRYGLNLYSQVTNPAAAANGAGEVVLAVLSQVTPSFAPTKKYGDVSVGGTVLYRFNAAGNLVFEVEVGGTLGNFGTPVVALDGSGNSYVMGTAAASGLPVTTHSYLASPDVQPAGYLCKLGSTGDLVFCTYLKVSRPISIAIDAAGDIYVGGQQPASSGPIVATPGALSEGGGSIFVLKLAGDGSRLLYAARFGGSLTGSLSAMTVGRSGGVFLAGTTVSKDFPVTQDAALGHAPSGDVFTTTFIAGLDPSGRSLTYASYGPSELPVAIGVDDASNLYWAGADRYDLIVRKYRGGGPEMTYERRVVSGSTGLTNALPTGGRASKIFLSVDRAGNANLSGTVRASNFPLYNPSQTCHSGNIVGLPDGYLIRLTPDGAIAQSTYLVSTGSVLPLAIGANSDGGSLAVVASDTNGAPAGFRVLKLGPGVAGAPQTLSCIGNAATLLPYTVSPGEVVSVFGEGIGPEAATPSVVANGRVRTILGDTQLTFDGIPAPILYASSFQINAIAPWEIAGQTTTKVCVLMSGKQTNCIVLDVRQCDPGIFTSNNGAAIVVKADGTVNSSTNPAAIGSIVSIYLTGMGLTTPIAPDGAINDGSPFAVQHNAVTLWLLSPDSVWERGEMAYAGPAPLQPAGMTRVDFKASRGIFQLRVLTPDGNEFDTDLFSVYTSQ